MKDFEDSTLWRVSEFERQRFMNGGSAFARLDAATVLPSTLLNDLRRLDAVNASDDPLEVIAACMRHREPALLCLQCEGLVWPITVFPTQMVYHSPRDMTQTLPGALSRLTLLSTEPPGLKPPGHWQHERISHPEQYRPLQSLLWTLALDGPRATLLNEIAGPSVYRAIKNIDEEGAPLGGAMRSAAQRLRRESVPLRELAGWPGMSTERASRLLNAMYLASALLTSRSHPSTRGGLRALLSGRSRPN